MMDDFTPPPFVPGMLWWVCSYEKDGDRYTISIPAKTANDAEALLHEQFGQGQVDGQLYGTIEGGRDDG